MSGNYDFLSRTYGVLCVCGKWPGQHRWGDNACPNSLWKCGNGQPQWRERTYYQPFTPTPPRALGGN